MSRTARLSLRLEPDLKEWLEGEARRSDRSAGYIAAHAIAAAKARSDARRSQIVQAMAEADKGVFVSEERMTEWFLSLGTDNELPEPEADILPNQRA